MCGLKPRRILFPCSDIGAVVETKHLPRCIESRCLGWTCSNTPKEAKLHVRQCFFCASLRVSSFRGFYSQRDPNAAAATAAHHLTARVICCFALVGQNGANYTPSQNQIQARFVIIGGLEDWRIGGCPVRKICDYGSDEILRAQIAPLIFGIGRRKRSRLRRTESASSAGGERRCRPRGQSFCGRRDCADAAQDYAGRKGGARNGGETFPANAPRATAGCIGPLAERTDAKSRAPLSGRPRRQSSDWRAGRTQRGGRLFAREYRWADAARRFGHGKQVSTENRYYLFLETQPKHGGGRSRRGATLPVRRHGGGGATPDHSRLGGTPRPTSTRVICCFAVQSKAPAGKTPRKISYPHGKYKRKFVIIGKPRGTKSKIEITVRTKSDDNPAIREFQRHSFTRIWCGRNLAKKSMRILHKLRRDIGTHTLRVFDAWRAIPRSELLTKHQNPPSNSSRAADSKNAETRTMTSRLKGTVLTCGVELNLPRRF